MGCTYNGTEYSDGAEICRYGTKFRCRNDGWENVGTCSDCDEASLLPSIQIIANFIQTVPSEAEKFKADPTQYLINKLGMAGMTIPSELHAHYTENDELLPPEEESLVPTARDVFEFSDGGGVRFIQDSGSISTLGSCNNCGFCIVITF